MEEGAVELVVQVVDELGYQGISNPVDVNIVIDRPLPPTPVPTAEPQESIPQTPSTPLFRWDLLAGAVIFLFLILLALFWQRRRKLAKQALANKERLNIEDPNAIAADGVVLIASLEALSGKAEESFPD